MYLIKSKQISRRMCSENTGISHLKLHVEIESKKDKTKQSLYDLYVNEIETRCHCDFDCCGHWFSTLISVERRGNAVFMKLAYAQNY